MFLIDSYAVAARSAKLFNFIYTPTPCDNLQNKVLTHFSLNTQPLPSFTLLSVSIIYILTKSFEVKV